MKLAVVLLLTLVVLLKTVDSEGDFSKHSEESNSDLNRTSDRAYYDVDADIEAFMEERLKQAFGKYYRPGDRPEPPRRPTRPRRPRPTRRRQRQPPRPAPTTTPPLIKADDINDEETCRRIMQEKKKITNDVWEKCQIIKNANGNYVEYEQCRNIERYYEKSFVREETKRACDGIILEKETFSLSETQTRKKCERVLKKTGKKSVVSMKVKLRCLELAYNPGDYLDLPICQRLGLINLNEEANTPPNKPPATTKAPPATTKASPTTTIAPPATTTVTPTTTKASPTTTIAPPTTTSAITTTTEEEGIDPLSDKRTVNAPHSVNASPRLLYISSLQDQCSTIASFLKIDDDTAQRILGLSNACKKMYYYEIPLDLLSSKAPIVKEYCPEIMKNVNSEG